VVLLHVLRSEPYRLVVGHVDHRLRAESAKDARFVRRFAEELELPFRGARVNVRGHSKQNGMGLEEAARFLRYRELTRIAKRLHCAAIVTAHTLNDQAETVLMNLLRGAGPSGLAGMPSCRRENPRIVRPFLHVQRKEILAYLRQHKIRYRVDKTNQSLDYSRNRIRLRTLPYLEKLWPGLQRRLANTALVFREEEDFWTQTISRELLKTVRKNGQSETVVLPGLLQYHKALTRRILRSVLPNLSFQELEQVLRVARSSREESFFMLPGGCRVGRRNGKLVISRERN
jgi:tRNA(Ile)-lysidine synthase